MDLIAANGFGYQSYRVITKDGYILQIHRIISKKSGPPILLQHGFSLASDIFVMCNRKSSLGKVQSLRLWVILPYLTRIILAQVEQLLKPFNILYL